MNPISKEKFDKIIDFILKNNDMPRIYQYNEYFKDSFGMRYYTEHYQVELYKSKLWAMLWVLDLMGVDIKDWIFSYLTWENAMLEFKNIEPWVSHNMDSVEAMKKFLYFIYCDRLRTKKGDA